MKNKKLTFLDPTPQVTQDSPMYQLPSIPPPDSFVVSFNGNGKPLSRYGDDNWDFTAFGSKGFNFTNRELSSANLKLVKQALITVFYHPRLFPGKIASCRGAFYCLVKIAQVCSKHGVLISEVSRFSRIHSEIAKLFTPGAYKEYISFLHKLRLFSDVVGFEVADTQMLQFLAARKPSHIVRQHPYIPPRIWSYRVNRINEALDDYLKIKDSSDRAYKWLIDAYASNKALGGPQCNWSPLSEGSVKQRKKRVVYPGGAVRFFDDHNLTEVIYKWLGRKPDSLTIMTTYLNVIRDLSFLFITCFSMQRTSEVRSLRTDCWKSEKDDRLGEVSLLVGETTKTDPDSDARWVVPSHVKKAVDIVAGIARFRALNAGVTGGSIPLALAANEPWTPSSCRELKVLAHLRHSALVRDMPTFFSDPNLEVTEEDWKIAVAVTPDLGEREEFGVGKAWVFSNHQFRRTTSVNMFASDMVSENSLQWSMKHANRYMTLYYGRNYTRLRLNSSVEESVIMESYDATYRKIAEMADNSVEFVIPHNKGMAPSTLINMINEGEEKKLKELIKNGLAGCRSTLLGYCMKSSACEYGGIESVAKCAGVPNGGICTDAIFAKKNRPKLIALKNIHEKNMESEAPSTPRYSALKQEAHAIGVYLNVVNS